MSKSMAIVMIVMMTSKVTGFLRETVLAANFGRNAMTDAYKVAFELPCLFLSIVIAAISATFIPVYNSRLQKGEKEAAHFVNNLYTMGMALSVLISLVTLLFIDQLAVWMMPDAAPETQRLTVELARMMMPMGIFVFLHRLTTAYLQAKFHFAVPALAPLFGNLCILGSIVISRGRSIEIVAIGSLVGMMMQFIVQVPSALRADLRYKPTFDVRESGMREVAMLMIPVIIASAFDSLYIVFDRMITSGNPGDITALDYGNRVSTMVSAVLLSTIATVLYPNLVRDADDRARYQRHLIL
ncbi:MAG: lipid II flippase MurJ, partial [Clostridia bacterium]